jgi:hypothetical protein
MYFMAIWNNLRSFGIFSPVLVSCTEKNLATLVQADNSGSTSIGRLFTNPDRTKTFFSKIIISDRCTFADIFSLKRTIHVCTPSQLSTTALLCFPSKLLTQAGFKLSSIHEADTG